MATLSWKEFVADADAFVQRALSEFWRSRKAWHRIRFVESAGVVRTLVDSPFAIFNNIIESAFPEDRAEKDLEAALTELKAAPANSTWFVGGLTSPRNLTQRLVARGYTQRVATVAIGISLNEMPWENEVQRESDPADFQVVEVTDDSMLSRWVEIESAVYGFPREMQALWFEMQSKSGYGPGQRWHHYLGSVDDHPTCTLSAFHGENIAAYCNLTVLAHQRQRGLGSAMMHAALRQARDEGYQVGVSAANPTALALCTRLGFERFGSVDFVSVGPEANVTDIFSGQRVSRQ